MVIIGVAVLVFGGAYLWSGVWKEKSAVPQAGSGRVERGTLQDGPEFVESIAYLAGGDPGDPRLIFVHGTPGSSSAWEDYLADPPPGYRAMAYDRPGFGETRPARPVPSLAGQAQVLARFLIRKKGRLPILVGHSLGGAIICRAAADYPDRVAGLVVVSGSLDPALERISWYQKAARLPVIRSVLPRELTNSVEELLPLKKELEELRPLLARIRCPVVIIHGDEDGLVPVENAAYLRDALLDSPRVEVVIHRGMGHLLIWRNKDVVRKDLARAVALIGEETGG